MKFNYLITLAITLFVVIPCKSQSPTEVLEDTKINFFNKAKVSFNQIHFSPNPVGKIDTSSYKLTVLKNTKSLTGYDAVVDGKYFDHYYINDDYKYVNHFKKVVKLFSDQKPEYRKAVIESSVSYSRSPMVLLRDVKWEFVKDTLIDNKKYKNYMNVINDKIVDGNTVYTEQHLFINPESKLPGRWERRNYFKGSLSQRVIVVYEDFKLSDDETPLLINVPKTYPSGLFSQKKTVLPIEKGEKAPEFERKDLAGNTISLADFKGKKVLLKFSSFSCGNSHEALLYMNQDDYRLPENIEPIYLAMWDKEADVMDYFSKVKTEMPVLPFSGDIAERYHVTSTPTFILVDEKGIIENVVIGFDKDFLNKLNQNNR